MRYVGFAALVATFWLLVATVRLILTHECPAAQSAAQVAIPTPVSAPPVNARPCTLQLR